MTRMQGLSGGLALLALSLCFATSASAQATRTWISGVGDDANPCSRTAPCKTFAGAISKTAAGGEIDCLDPGGFGAVTITKSITIDCGGGMSGQAGGILNSATHGVIINAGASDRIIIRNLIINGGSPISPGLSGIRFIAGGSLTIEHVVIIAVGGVSGNPALPSPAIDFRPAAPARLFMRDVEINHTISTAINISNASATLDNLFISASGGNALQVGDSASVTVSNSKLVGNGSKGVLLNAMNMTSEVNLEGVQVNNSLGQAVQANGASATLRLSNCAIYNNAAGLLAINGATIASYGNNRIAGNNNNGSATSMAMQQ